ncbi:MAG: nitrogen fixation protein NifC, partial [Oscillospiraceae bacterium]|nr:nitrogen fixation protein NifC [Oscillospiraceae bacterium]
MKDNSMNAFRLLCCIFTVISLLLIGGSILTIILRGAESLPECLRSPNTRFALGLSIRTASISTLLCFLLAIPTSYILSQMPKKL